MGILRHKITFLFGYIFCSVQTLQLVGDKRNHPLRNWPLLKVYKCKSLIKIAFVLLWRCRSSTFNTRSVSGQFESRFQPIQFLHVRSVYSTILNYQVWLWNKILSVLRFSCISCHLHSPDVINQGLKQRIMKLLFSHFVFYPLYYYFRCVRICHSCQYFFGEVNMKDCNCDPTLIYEGLNQ